MHATSYHQHPVEDHRQVWHDMQLALLMVGITALGLIVVVAQAAHYMTRVIA